MLRFALLLMFAVGVLFAGTSSAQDAGQKTRDLLSALDKTKYKKKEKKNISIEVYVDIKNVGALNSDPTEYSGTYLTEGYRLELKASKSGEVTGSGYDSTNTDGRPVNFTLRDAHINGALLSAVKVYASGESRKFVAAFVNRTEKVGKNSNDIETENTKFGLGFIESGPVVAGAAEKSTDWTNRVFLERR